MSEKAVKTFADLTPQEVEEFAERAREIREAFMQVWDGVSRMVNAAVASITAHWDWIKEGRDKCHDITFLRAYCWACGARPEWVAVLNRTKKKRTRKKYQDRILRAYLENIGES